MATCRHDDTHVAMTTCTDSSVLIIICIFQQTTVDEFANDADYLFPILFQDSSFEGAFLSLTQDSTHQAVSQALKVLHTAPDPHEEGVVMIDFPPSACLVISLLQQWLIRHMIKELMKLMTSEAVTLHRKKIPTSYIDNYLAYQQHFSLKKLLDLQLRALQSCDGRERLHIMLYTTQWRLPLQWGRSTFGAIQSVLMSEVILYIICAFGTNESVLIREVSILRGSPLYIIPYKFIITLLFVLIL